MKKFISIFFFFGLTFTALAQAKKSEVKSTKPKLVVGIVIDQMRWDYLYQYQKLFATQGGFNRLLQQGFSCQNTLIPYTPTVTACGHTCAYTGSVPNIHGIVGNNWYDKNTQKTMYCSEDKSVNGVGNTKGSAGQMSPKNMLVTTIADELKIHQNFKNKTIGISIKDRGAILPAGHSANAAYWFDSKTGNFITSSYYMQQLPTWVNQFNNRQLPDSLLNLGWQKSLTDDEYKKYATQQDAQTYESKPFGKDQLQLPYVLKTTKDADYGKLSVTPHGNTYVTEMAKAAIINEQLGKNNYTDFIAISYSSPDYIGHSFGPNSWENVDDYVKLDANLNQLFSFLDAQLGAGNYTAFLTADHGVAHIPQYLKDNKIPAGSFNDGSFVKAINDSIHQLFGVEKAIVASDNYQLTLKKLTAQSPETNNNITNYIIDKLLQQPEVMHAFSLTQLSQTLLNSTIKEMISNGYSPTRSGDIMYILKPAYIEGGNTGTTHGLWNPYDAHIPLIWYGFGINKGATHRTVFMTDIAPTLAALLKIQMPNGNIGHVIQEVLK